MTKSNGLTKAVDEVLSVIGNSSRFVIIARDAIQMYATLFGVQDLVAAAVAFSEDDVNPTVCQPQLLDMKVGTAEQAIVDFYPLSKRLLERSIILEQAISRLSTFVKDSTTLRLPVVAKSSWVKVEASLRASFEGVHQFMSYLANGEEVQRSIMEEVRTEGKLRERHTLSSESQLVPMQVELTLTASQLARHGWTQSVVADGLQKDLENVL
eukprot:CAMPEP_0113908426 /NCGR_PEP_ID=MMETSP0780_2-20120614/26152_1 /TAXON_ID=652834 /ORGANISM="Palpitomonas bilix" /LENGTH=210 /DNA_ID=CAMNT_0000903847 /DNA_START=380 /DNA_END=1008 /DNA_ORIENTATION=- /assembly_acc=CAM_ASM_000599